MDIQSNKNNITEPDFQISNPIDSLLDQIEKLEHRLDNLDKIESQTRHNIEKSLTPIESD